jgi:hypothetical protein
MLYEEWIFELFSLLYIFFVGGGGGGHWQKTGKRRCELPELFLLTLPLMFPLCGSCQNWERRNMVYRVRTIN